MSAKKIGAFVGTLVGLCSLIGAVVAVDSHYAKQEYVEKIEQRLDQKIWSDRYYQIQRRIWQLQDRYPNGVRMPESVQEELRELEFIKKQIERKLKLPTEQVGALVVAVARAKATAGAPTKPKGVTVSDNGRAVELTTKELCMV